MGLASLLIGPAAAVPHLFCGPVGPSSSFAHDLSRKPVPALRQRGPPGWDHALDTALEPARKLAKTLNQGFGAVDGLDPGLDIPEPGQVCLARLLTQGQLRILQFSK